MIDDMQGIFKSASAANDAGKATGVGQLYTATMFRLSRLSVQAEKAGDAAGFHNFEAACAALRNAKETIDRDAKLEAATAQGEG